MPVGAGRFTIYLPLVLALLCWAFPPVMMRWIVGAGVDVWTMSVYRMFTGVLVLVPFGVLWNFDGVRRAAMAPWQFLFPAALFTISMVLWVLGLMRLGASIATLVGRSDVLFAVLLGVMFFADERRVIQDARFLGAVCVAFAGVIGVVLFRDVGTAGGALVLHGRFSTGVVLSFGASFAWVAYVYSVKVTVRRLGSIVTFIMVALEAAFMMLAVAAVMQFLGRADLWLPWKLGIKANAILWGSGIIGVGIGGILFYRSIDLVGVAVSQTSTLVLPLFTGVAAYVFLGERLTWMQVMSGAVLLGSLGYIVLVRSREGIVSTETAKTIRWPV